jgi:hypothetical protein
MRCISSPRGGRTARVSSIGSLQPLPGRARGLRGLRNPTAPWEAPRVSSMNRSDRTFGVALQIIPNSSFAVSNLFNDFRRKNLRKLPRLGSSDQKRGGVQSHRNASYITVSGIQKENCRSSAQRSRSPGASPAIASWVRRVKRPRARRVDPRPYHPRSAVLYKPPLFARPHRPPGDPSAHARRLRTER